MNLHFFYRKNPSSPSKRVKNATENSTPKLTSSLAKLLLKNRNQNQPSRRALNWRNRIARWNFVWASWKVTRAPEPRPSFKHFRANCFRLKMSATKRQSKYTFWMYAKKLHTSWFIRVISSLISKSHSECSKFLSGPNFLIKLKILDLVTICQSCYDAPRRKSRTPIYRWKRSAAPPSSIKNR